MQKICTVLCYGFPLIHYHKDKPAGVALLLDENSIVCKYIVLLFLIKPWQSINVVCYIIVNFHCAKLPWEHFRQKRGSYVRNTWRWMNYILWYTHSVKSLIYLWRKVVYLIQNKRNSYSHMYCNGSVNIITVKYLLLLL